MPSSTKINKRTPSKVKPFVYLLLQIIIVIEVFTLFNKSFNVTTWSWIEIVIALGFISYFIRRTFVILDRTHIMENKWYDVMEMQRFLRNK